MIDGPVHTCEAPDCAAASTHVVTIAPAGEPETTTRLCRAHDRSLKTDTVRNRPRKPAEVLVEVPNVVRCGACGQLIGEPSSLDPLLRQACPVCESKSRAIQVYLNDTLSFHESISTKLHPSGGKWTVKSEGGDSYTRGLEAWGHLERVVDRPTDSYREVIELWDGTRIVSVAKLSDHYD